MRRAFLALLVLCLAVAGVGCPCARGAINASPEIRWWLFSNFGASKVCPEMLKRGVPLKLAAFGNASVGRFFPSSCRVQVDDARKVMVTSVAGTGYVTVPFTRRVGFFVNASIEYAPDFRLEEDSMYVWGRFTRFIAQPEMRILGVENPVVNLATKTPIGDVASIIGNGILTSEIGKGFTVVRQDDGDDFTLGHLEPPEKPKRQFKAGEGRIVLASDLASIRPTSREYLGPFEIADKGAALFFRAKVDGAPLVYAVVERSVGDAWRAQYETVQPMQPPPGPILRQGALAVGEAKLAIPLERGSYYVVLENQAPAPFAPIGVALPGAEQLAYVSYLAEVGDRD